MPYGHPDAVRLIAEVQQEYVTRYGDQDRTPLSPAEFSPPNGLFLLGYEDEAAAACGGWRSRGSDAEIKRMYVVRTARRRGLARLMLAELERTAREAGHRRVILETGRKQPEAVALYQSAGYAPIPAFGHYACAPGSVHLAKLLDGGPGQETAYTAANH